MFDPHLWRQKVARYRKWEHRHDRAVKPDTRKAYAQVMAQFYMDLSNEARAMVEEYREGARTRDNENFLMDEREFITWTSDGLKYKLKVTNEDPDRHWFQRFENEPWFDLGYMNKATGKYQDPRPSESFADIIARNRAIDIQHSINKGMKFPGMYPGAGATAPSYPRTDHIHIEQALAATPLATWKDIDPMLSSTNPDDLEAAAARAMGEAAKIRAYAALEPSGDEPTITWKWAPEYADATTYTYVAFKSGNGRWYTTGDGTGHRTGLTWRDLGENQWAEPLTRGDFLIVTEWSAYEGGE